MPTPYTHAEFKPYGSLYWALAETVNTRLKYEANTEANTEAVRNVVLSVPVGNGTIAELLLSKKAAATLAGHLLQASDADDLTAVGDDK